MSQKIQKKIFQNIIKQYNLTCGEKISQIVGMKLSVWILQKHIKNNPKDVDSIRSIKMISSHLKALHITEEENNKLENIYNSIKELLNLYEFNE